MATAVRSVVSRFLARYSGIEGGVLLRGKVFQQLGEKYPSFKKFNNVLTVAPAWKWGLAAVPLYGAVSGDVQVENIDLKTSGALSLTGIVWAYYGMLVRPTAYLLVAVNMALLAVNGTNVARKVMYNRELAAATDLSVVDTLQVIPAPALTAVPAADVTVVTPSVTVAESDVADADK
ncbi:uncharacterized protein AMSG_02278 [Thecamonas trahens ATCC 50062]|uniref:Mitochondrial pyruvate carrier n=1 Tax=Thecamonas trahens ATCC 50062 TaxID=461836 RepID=A0A0L0DXP3_THETB|nr:hypothetical protein AMSG_02278 [Thecamonas trahens ATCC 50062]KNC56308.1 hypothetical protein AMSG_02278 [Thecamonas trahens ATCC 50062]|eukprot:XP_013760827.1 hypothetical protein AMSG_02278 [Thecamonas trahens ATCC 50062]